ncbi:MAG: hypothetical protein IPH44_02525 [Myxococcales bacterium]|nr:hypothetical protein [Myxococcales bacterium]MBK7198194.1 hypothetical protein [Myxococcales bacterium]MBP6846942.1 hypothetical protein [Kofleriaceae bacterium]
MLRAALFAATRAATLAATRAATLALGLVACGPAIEGEVTVVGGTDACRDRTGAPIAGVTVEVRDAGDTRAADDVPCGGRFSLDSGSGSYYLHAVVYTADGTTRLGYTAVGPFEVGEQDLDVGTLVVSL